MITAAVALMIALSAGATVAVADNSRPGDALFGVDRAAENVRIAFAGDDKKDELRVRFANERADEFEEIVEEESENIRLARADRGSSESAPAAEVSLMLATESNVSAKIADDADDNSDDDSNDDSSESEVRIANGLSVAISYLTEVSNELSVKGNAEAKAEIDAVIARLNAKIADSEIRDFNIRFESGDDNGIRAEIRSEGEASGGGGIEVRGDGVKTKIEFEDGRVKFETEVDDSGDDSSDDDSRGVDNPRDFPDDSSDDSDDDSDDSDDDSDDSPAPTSSGMEIEADMFLDLTVVKVEQNDQKQSFSTSARTRAEIVAAIASELGVAEADVDAALSLENENRLSRPEDLMWSGSSGGSGDNDED